MRLLFVLFLAVAAAAPSAARAQDDPGFELRLERVEDITGVIERVCLSGHEVSGDASLEAGISGLKQILANGLSGSLSAEAAARNARGAVGILEDKVKLDENAAIRRCMEPYLERIVNYLLVVEESGSENQACWEITVKHPEQFPYYLKNSISLSDRFYWFYVDIENRCASTLYASVTFKPDLPERDLPSIDYLKGAELMTLRPGERKQKTIDPRIRFLDRLERAFPMKVDWNVKDDSEALLGQGSIDIQVLPPDHFVWDLKDPDGKPIEKSFLLASLAAWPQNQPQRVQEMADAIMSSIEIDFGAPLADIAKSWMAGVHEAVFAGPDRIRVFPTARRFPPNVQSRAIRAPGDLFERGRADPLEAALLVRAVSGQFFVDLGIDQLLIIAADPERPGGQRVYLAWSGLDSGEWQAVHAGELGWKPFDANIADATAAVREMAEVDTLSRGRLGSGGGVEASTCSGAFFDEDAGLYVIDFLRARDCGIAGLPF